jgi:hypothetical protein
VSLRVLALDPGERVGWATGWIEDGVRLLGDDGVETVVADTKLLRVDNHGISFLKDMALKVFEVAKDYDVIVYETWRLRPNKAKAFIGSDFPSVQFIGMVRLAAWVSGTKLVSQGPSVKHTAEKYARAHLPDVAARLDKMPKAHDDGHDGDALLHLANFYFDRYAK